MPLTDSQKRHLRGLGHSLKPLIIVGDKGISEGLIEETRSTITHHELIKVRVNAMDRESRDAMIATLCEACKAELIQRIGHVALLFKRNIDKPRIEIPAR
ncbi:RNA-binding protein [Solemya pervernicosa gill symbiont]|uniref:RNA-binding protein n=1 Tax=Solemya pervernicosa gill symbiont TaxID=642797 RepID=A0A1T2L9J2_9GAMM|nr:RNA-binding protein [Solemya pervernicosa gill symbiont]